MKRTPIIAAFLAVAVAAGAAAAYARWSSTVDGTAAARSQGLAGNAPTAAAVGSDVTVSWAAATFSDGTAATSYAVTRYNGAGVAQATLADCAGSIATLSCVEHNVPAGTWQYAVTPKYANWTGTESAKSLPVVVAALDSSAPALQALEMSDANGNGKVDRVVATFNETLATPYLAGTTGWTLANVPSGGSLASVAVSGSSATLTLTEGAGAIDTGVGSFTVALAATAGGIRDTFDNRSSFAATAPADKVAPKLVGMEMLDADRDGLVDRVTATFTEALAASTATAPWTLANVPSGGSPASVSTSGAVATLTLNEGTGARNTAVGGFTVALSSAAAGVRDAADNRASFAATAPTDKAAPVGFVTLTNGGTLGKSDKGDTLTVTYSERLTLSTVCAAWTDNTTDQTLFANNDVTVTVATNDVLSMSSLACPSLAVGSVVLGGDYVTGSTAAKFGPDNGDSKRSEVRWTAATNTLTAYLGTLTAGTTANVAGSGTARYTPASGITDLVGNAIGSITFDTASQRF